LGGLIQRRNGQKQLKRVETEIVWCTVLSGDSQLTHTARHQHPSIIFLQDLF